MLHEVAGFALPIPILLAVALSAAFRDDAGRLNRFRPSDWQWLRSTRPPQRTHPRRQVQRRAEAQRSLHPRRDHRHAHDGRDDVLQQPASPTTCAPGPRSCTTGWPWRSPSSVGRARLHGVQRRDGPRWACEPARCRSSWARARAPGLGRRIPGSSPAGSPRPPMARRPWGPRPGARRHARRRVGGVSAPAILGHAGQQAVDVVGVACTARVRRGRLPPHRARSTPTPRGRRRSRPAH